VCGRYISVKSRSDLVELYDATPVGPELAESFNVAPTNTVYAIVEHADERAGGRLDRQVRDLQWGLVPSWAKDPQIGNKLINARVETLADKPSWRTAFRKRRAIVPARGYYEWSPREHDGKVRKQPYYLHPPGGGVLAFAALYEMWRDPAKADDDPDRWLWSTVIITTDATGPAGEVHDRTPLILPPDRIGAWLDPRRTNPEQIYQVLDGIVMDPLEVRPVATQVNRVGNDGPQLLDPLDVNHPDEPLQLTLTGRAA
jgi:putative SOS response-associated peptidase YedK